MRFWGQLFSNYQSEINRYSKVLKQINDLEPKLERQSDQDLRAISRGLREELRDSTQQIIAATLKLEEGERKKARREAVDQLLEPKIAEAFALVREVAKRTLGLRHFDVQLIGGLVLHEGKIAEMKTGEGKTLVASLTLYLNALTGLGAHLVTVNDYLARIGAGWMGPIYHFLGLSVGVIGPQFSYRYDPQATNEETDWRLQHFRPCSRQEAYQADITYGTNNEFGFDYLRDNMASDRSAIAQRELVYAIVDEVDSILIDEARTPLIISAPATRSAELYTKFAQYLPKLRPGIDYTVDEKARTAVLTSSGIDRLEQLIGVTNLYDPDHVQLVHYINESLKAHALFKRNRDYVVRDGEVVIVDEFTGRLLAGRRYSGGLHQAIEAKEGVPVKEESVTLATITFQNYFRLYDKLAGMTGTAATEAEEFAKIYQLEVVTIPTNRPINRVDRQDLIYKNQSAKLKAVVELVRERQAVGQPVLIGTVSIDKSEALSRLLSSAGIKHTVLNAKYHQKEGEIIAQAGKPGAVTVATNMAGRGVDIVLGGALPEKKDAQTVAKWEKQRQRVLEAGGLFVIGTERHESRRIDNQLRGRAGRQGDPGVTQFFISMEDDLMRIFGGERLKRLMERLNLPDDVSINNKLLSRAIEQAQSRVEGHNFDLRKHLLEYDDVMNKHREAIYRQRRRLLMVADEEVVAEELHQSILSGMTEEEQQTYQQKSRNWSTDLRRQIEQTVSLRAIDVLWVEHLRAMEDLRETIELRGYGQREPIVEYKQEAFQLFDNLQRTITAQVNQMLLHLQLESDSQLLTQTPVRTSLVRDRDSDLLVSNAQNPRQLSPEAPTSKIGRNDPCPCGAVDPKTGRVFKYKKCGLINAPHHRL